MSILALETSGLAGSIALINGPLRIERRLEQTGRRHAQTLTQEIAELLTEHQLTPRDLTAIGVSLGPGSFTGLRVGVMCTKTLGYALGCRVYGIDTYLAVAEAIVDPTLQRLFVIGDAQRGDFFVGEYQRLPAGPWVRQGELQVVHGTEWLAARLSTDVIAGPGVTKCSADETTARLLTTPESTQPSALAVADVTVLRMASEPGDDLWRMAPIYLRPSAAEEQRAKRDQNSAQESSGGGPG
jgi:tRNA threonylcarbamoyladenosine biosynthesis protein TsaB